MTAEIAMMPRRTPMPSQNFDLSRSGAPGVRWYINSIAPMSQITVKINANIRNAANGRAAAKASGTR